MTENPQCSRCENTSVMSVNGRQACLDHVDDVMAEAFAPLSELRKAAE